MRRASTQSHVPTGRATGAIDEFAAGVERPSNDGRRRFNRSEARNENRIGGSAARAESRGQWVSGRRGTPERDGSGPAAPGGTARPASIEGQANLTRGGRRRRRRPDDDRSAVGLGRRGDGLHVSPRGREPSALKRDRSDGPAPHVPPRHSRGKSPAATARPTAPVIGTADRSQWALPCRWLGVRMMSGQSQECRGRAGNEAGVHLSSPQSSGEGTGRYGPGFQHSRRFETGGR